MAGPPGEAKGNLYFVEWRNGAGHLKRSSDGVTVSFDKSGITGSRFFRRSYLIRLAAGSWSLFEENVDSTIQRWRLPTAAHNQFVWSLGFEYKLTSRATRTARKS